MEDILKIDFAAEVIYWRGPSPFYFVRIPPRHAGAIRDLAAQVSYGWGVIPCDVTIATTSFYTALIPKDGSYLVPLKKVVRDAVGLDVGNKQSLTIEISRTPR